MDEKPKTRRSPYIWVAIGVGVAAAIGIAAAAIFAANNPSTSPSTSETLNLAEVVVPPDSKPYGKTYAEWNVEWWKWAQMEPAENNPMFDQTGEKCDVNQDDPDVWFLAGTGGGAAERTCDIPSSKAIFFPLITTECSQAEDPSLRTEAALLDCARNNAPDRARLVLSASIDGQEIPDLKKYWVESSMYDYTLPESNIWGAPAGPTKEVAAGYYIMLNPLTPGDHLIKFSGASLDISGTQTFATEATYHVTIVED